MKIFKFTLALCASMLMLNACQKETSDESASIKLPVGNWEFVNGGAAYMGNMDSAYIIAAGATNALYLNGTSLDGSQHFQLILYSNSSFAPGDYKASLFQSVFNYTLPAKTIYEGNQLNGEFIVNIATFSNNLVTGTFSGAVLDSTHAAKNITNGKFKATLGTGSGNPGGGTPVSNDYFPLTANSYWKQYSADNMDSFLQKVIPYNPTFAGKSYQAIQESDLLSPTDLSLMDSLYYRKPGGDYYQYVDLSDFFGFDNPVKIDYIFLKDNVASGTTWQSTQANGVSSGQSYSTLIKMTLLSKETAVTINGSNFPDVIKVQYDYYIGVAPAAPSVVFYTQERWFAKNVGEIYNKLDEVFPQPQPGWVYQVKEYKVF